MEKVSATKRLNRAFQSPTLILLFKKSGQVIIIVGVIILMILIGVLLFKFLAHFITNLVASIVSIIFLSHISL